jgi:UPF0042 nucleotide-binding protein
MYLVVITGLSGAGKTKTLKTFEDWGYFCIDNLPPQLITTFMELYINTELQEKKVAIATDVRGGIFFEELEKELSKIADYGIQYDILFLDAEDSVIIKRFKENRRKHPLSREGNLQAGINSERKKLEPIKKISTIHIDTSQCSIKELKKLLSDKLSIKPEKKSKQLEVTLSSFGYKYGIPLDADIVFDVRFLPNPFYIHELRALTGSDRAVQEYLLSFDATNEFIKHLNNLFDFLLPKYIDENRRQLNVCFGCTGGQHRSVLFAEYYAEYFKNHNIKTYINHEDMLENVMEVKERMRIAEERTKREE